MALIGIDVGNANCKFALHDGRGYRFISERMPDNVVRDNEVVSPESLSKFLRTLRREKRIRDRNCVLVLNTSNIYFRHVTLPPMTVPELMLNLPYEFRDFIQDDPDEYTYDYAVDEIVRDEEGNVERMELYAAAVRTSLIDSYAQFLRKAGFKLKSVTPAPMAYMALIRSYCESVEGETPDGHDIVLVDIGHANVTIYLFRGWHFDSARTIDFGCDEFDRVIADMKGIDPYTAGNYKLNNFEGVMDDPECLAVCDRFALEVSKVVNFYNFNNPDREIDLMCFLGSGSRIPQLTDAISEAVPLPTDTIDALMPESVVDEENASVCALAFCGLLESEAK